MLICEGSVEPGTLSVLPCVSCLIIHFSSPAGGSGLASLSWEPSALAGGSGLADLVGESSALTGSVIPLDGNHYGRSKDGIPGGKC